MYLTIEFLPAYLSVTPHVPYFINKQDVVGSKKKKKTVQLKKAKYKGGVVSTAMNLIENCSIFIVL